MKYENILEKFKYLQRHTSTLNLTNKYLILHQRIAEQQLVRLDISGSRPDHLQVVTYTLDLGLGLGHSAPHHIIPSLAPDRQNFLLSLKIIQISEQLWNDDSQDRPGISTNISKYVLIDMKE